MGTTPTYEHAVQKTIRDSFGLSPRSRQRLEDAFARTCCAGCGRRVPIRNRVVVWVNEEPRVFHSGCQDDGPVRVQFEALVAARQPKSRESLEARIRAARAWRG